MRPPPSNVIVGVALGFFLFLALVGGEFDRRLLMYIGAELANKTGVLTPFYYMILVAAAISVQFGALVTFVLDKLPTNR